MTFNYGDKLCSCTLLVKCGEGAYGEVWLAENAIGGKVALKILKKKFSEREIRGLQNYKDCDHPNLLKIRHIEISDDFVCYTMDAADDLNNGKGDYLPDTLANRLNKYGKLDGKEITAMLDGVLDGLEELHKHGLVHRDIKPDNILYINGRATLSDAGLIAPVGQNTLVGSPGFISPRLMESGGVAETSDDFYALSKVVFCALTGLAPAEYPTIPQEMTISVDPKINRAVLAGCSQEIKSSAEFRKLISKERASAPARSFPRIAVSVATAIILLLIIGTILFGLRQKTGTLEREETSVEKVSENTLLAPSSGEMVSAAPAAGVQKVETPVKAEPEYKIPDPIVDRSATADFERRFGVSCELELNDWFSRLSRYRGNYTSGNFETEFLLDRDMKIRELFRKTGLISGEYLEELLTRQLFAYESISGELDILFEKYYAKPQNRALYDMLRLLLHLYNSNATYSEQLLERQQYWRNQEGEADDIIRRMLTEDTVMQMAAVNMMLERFCRQVMQTFECNGKYDQIILGLVTLQNEFSKPLPELKREYRL